MGLLTFRAWTRSIMHRQILPVFRWNDPLPAVTGSASWIRYACLAPAFNGQKEVWCGTIEFSALVASSTVLRPLRSI